MKRKILKSFTALMIVGMFSSQTLAFAAGNNVSGDDQTLRNHGLQTNIIEAIDSNAKNNIANALRTDPSSVSINTSVTVVDNLAEVEKFCSYTDAELVNMGANSNEVVKERNMIEQWYATPDEQLADNYGLSQVETKLLKKAIDKGKAEFKNRKGSNANNDVVASGTISEGQLTYTEVAVDQRTSAPNYLVTCAYSWSYPYLLAIFNDEIAVGWGGALNTKNVSGGYHLRSVDFTSSNWTDSSVGYTPASITHENPNVSLEFAFPQSFNSLKTDSGSVSFNLYQTQRQGYDTKVVSNYLHREIGISASVDISVSGLAVTLTPVGSWNQSPQRSATISF